MTGCAISGYQPMPGDYQIEEGFAIIRTDSLQLAIRPQSYRGSYRDLNNNFFSMYVMVRNVSSSKLKLPQESFSLVSGGRQYDYIDLEFILSSYRQQYVFEQWQDPFNADPLQPVNNEQNIEGYYELMASSFTFGDLQAGASKEGYLFYDRNLHRASELVFDALGVPVTFVRGK
ncbi:MAG: hypothetical protein WCQ59_06135 [Candidatus Cloacimonadaceae bacterium]